MRLIPPLEVPEEAPPDSAEAATSGGRVGGVVEMDTISFARLRTVVTVSPSAMDTTVVTSPELDEALSAELVVEFAEEVAEPDDCVAPALAVASTLPEPAGVFPKLPAPVKLPRPARLLVLLIPVIFIALTV